MEFSKAFGLLLKKSLRTMWENVEDTDEERGRTRHDGEFLRYSTGTGGTRGSWTVVL